MKNIMIRRTMAFIIDYVLFCLVFALVGIIIFTMTMPLWEENGNMIFNIALYIIGVVMVLLWVYFLIFDCYPKLDLGKRLMKIEILSDDQIFSRSMALKHSALKMLASLIWPISFSYYFFSHKMIYDKYLRITIKDNFHHQLR